MHLKIASASVWKVHNDFELLDVVHFVRGVFTVPALDAYY